MPRWTCSALRKSSMLITTHICNVNAKPSVKVDVIFIAFGTIVIVIVLLVKTEHKNSAECKIS